MSKRSIRYLILTFLIMVLCWGTCAVCSRAGIFLTDAPLMYIPYLLGGFSPTVASYIVLRKERAAGSFKAWLASVFDLKHNALSYLLPLLFAAVFFLPLCSVSGYASGAPFYVLVFMVPAMLFGGGLEETGWRGILQTELEKKLPYTAATLAVAFIWWLWHLPLFYINGVSQYGADLFTFGINILGLSFALAAIKKTTGSTFLCVLFHCLTNALHGVFIVSESRIGSCAAAAALMVLSYIILWIQRKTRIFS